MPKNRFDTDEDIKQVMNLTDYLSANPKAGHKMIARDVVGAHRILYRYFDSSINNFKSWLGLPESAIFKPLVSNLLSYDEFMSRYHDVADFARNNPSFTKFDIKASNLTKAFDTLYHNALNKARKDFGIAPLTGFHYKLAPEVWEKRKEAFLSFLKNHPQASRKDLSDRPTIFSAFSHFYKGYIVPALHDAGYDEVSVRKFMESYHLDAAQSLVDGLVRYRDALGLASPPLEDLVQEASLRMMKTARAKPKMSRKLAIRTVQYGIKNFINIYGYPHSAVKSKTGGKLFSAIYKGAPSSRMIDTALTSDNPVDEKTADFLRTLNPTPLEYRMLLGDFDDDSVDVRLAVDTVEKLDSREYHARMNTPHQYHAKAGDILAALEHTKLSKREKEILGMRYLSSHPLTLDECGKVFNVTRERIRQIEVKAIEKLRVGSVKRSLARTLGLSLSVEQDDFQLSKKDELLAKEHFLAQERVRQEVRMRRLYAENNLKWKNALALMDKKAARNKGISYDTPNDGFE